MAMTMLGEYKTSERF
jgi:hypothetical protein